MRSPIDIALRGEQVDVLRMLVKWCTGSLQLAGLSMAKGDASCRLRMCPYATALHVYRCNEHHMKAGGGGTSPATPANGHLLGGHYFPRGSGVGVCSSNSDYKMKTNTFIARENQGSLVACISLQKKTLRIGWVTPVPSAGLPLKKFCSSISLPAW